jgi:hypothetical protein
MFNQQEKVGIFRFYESWLNRVCDEGRESDDLSFSSQSCLGYLAVGGIEGKVLKTTPVKVTKVWLSSEKSKSSNMRMFGVILLFSGRLFRTSWRG